MAFAYILWSYMPFSFLTTTQEVGPVVDVLLATTLLGGARASLRLETDPAACAQRLRLRLW